MGAVAIGVMARSRWPDTRAGSREVVGHREDGRDEVASREGMAGAQAWRCDHAWCRWARWAPPHRLRPTGLCPSPRLLPARAVHDRQGGPAAGAPRFTFL